MSLIFLPPQTSYYHRFPYHLPCLKYSLMTRGNPNLQERSLRASLFLRKGGKHFTQYTSMVKAGKQHTSCKATELSSDTNYKAVQACICSKAPHGVASHTGTTRATAHGPALRGGPRTWFNPLMLILKSLIF